ncbi:VOC family protein [Bacillus sp. Marseille-P3800]|uniref:VOC family protein n=1 Tax=Bacillus sp. Marseille-P3800 TaxID=2014782 RepID=UPI000C07DE06|nr:VOC family protein [Bacillus sp. Marseille-P3800]
MNSVIEKKLNTVFVHVSDLSASVDWYGKLLNLSPDLTTITNPVYTFTLDHHTSLTLDAGPSGEQKQIIPSPHPLFNFHTKEIEQAYTFATELVLSIYSDIVSYPDFSFFTVLDPDGHVIMICDG